MLEDSTLKSDESVATESSPSGLESKPEETGEKVPSSETKTKSESDESVETEAHPEEEALPSPDYNNLSPEVRAELEKRYKKTLSAFTKKTQELKQKMEEVEALKAEFEAKLEVLNDPQEVKNLLFEQLTPEEKQDLIKAGVSDEDFKKLLEEKKLIALPQEEINKLQEETVALEFDLFKTRHPDWETYKDDMLSIMEDFQKKKNTTLNFEEAYTFVKGKRPPEKPGIVGKGKIGTGAVEKNIRSRRKLEDIWEEAKAKYGPLYITTEK